MQADLCDDRQILRVTGADRIGFLQGLVTNDVAGLEDGLVYAALLTPQGKYLADFFLVPGDDAVLIDVDAALAPGLLQRLTMYKLRAEVAIESVELPVYRGLGVGPDGSFADPRSDALGWRHYGMLEAEPASVDWTALRVSEAVPQSGVELVPNGSYILELGFERLNGVDFRKGCYVGQEVTARMKHKTELAKGLAKVAVDGAADVGTEITAAGKPVGTLYTQTGGLGLAYLRFNRVTEGMMAGAAGIALLGDDGM